MSERDRVAADYAVHGVSTGPHLVSLLRVSLDALGCVPLARVAELPDGSRITVAGLVIARQAPVSAKGFRFFTLADEGAHLDLVFRPEVARRTRAVANASPLLLAEGTLEVSSGAATCSSPPSPPWTATAIRAPLQSLRGAAGVALDVARLPLTRTIRAIDGGRLEQRKRVVWSVRSVVSCG